MVDTTPIQTHRSMPRWMAIGVGLTAAVVLFVWILATPDGIDGKFDAIGYAICHRIDARSFLINGMPMPLCARCTGIYLGVMVSFFIALASGRGKASRLPSIPVGLALIGFVGIMGIDGVNSYIHLFPGGTGIYTPQNWLRLTTGMFCGIAMFSFTFPIFNGIVWREPERTRAINNLRELAGICAVAACVILLVLTEQPVFLWTFGLLSTVGVLLMLTMIGTVTFLSVTHLDRNVILWRHMAIPLLAGLTLAFIELGAMDLLRYVLTGTWNGFPLGG